MKSRTVVFRTDASIDIGTGHVMRCLTLAERLAEFGAKCLFLSRKHPGNLVEMVRERGFEVITLPRPALTREQTDDEALPAHAHWLGTTWQQDATETMDALAGRIFDWLVVDHYALEHRWESAVSTVCGRLMVIDDLADRRHKCALLLDQNLDREETDYAGLVPDGTLFLLGPHYALLRPEFGDLRARSLKRRDSGSVRRLLVSMGGVDKDNATGGVIAALRSLQPPLACNVQVVMGEFAPALDEVRYAAKKASFPVDVVTGPGNMAQLMAESDLAIGAAGGTSWERCCLGLPTIVLVLQDNQRRIAAGLVNAGAAEVFDPATGWEKLGRQLAGLLHDDARRRRMSEAAAALVDGRGAGRVAGVMLGADSE